MKALRAEADLTQEPLAERVHVARATIHFVERASGSPRRSWPSGSPGFSARRSRRCSTSADASRQTTISPLMTVTARPAILTRSPASFKRRTPPRAEAWKAVKDVFPSFLAQ
jgi:hypothetical protein